MWQKNRDEELLGRGLELHDQMQTLLAKHDAIASGSPMPVQQTASFTLQSTEKHIGPKESEVKQEQTPMPCVSPSTSTTTAISKSFIDEEEEEDDDFAQLARRLALIPIIYQQAKASRPNIH